MPPGRTLAELLLAMRRERQHIVLVSDGRVPLGVVTLDDVLTAVVGGELEAGIAMPFLTSQGPTSGTQAKYCRLSGHTT